MEEDEDSSMEEILEEEEEEEDEVPILKCNALCIPFRIINGKIVLKIKEEKGLDLINKTIKEEILEMLIIIKK
jgi:hypothetical protein